MKQSLAFHKRISPELIFCVFCLIVVLCGKPPEGLDPANPDLEIDKSPLVISEVLLLVCAALVFAMQAGFCCLEAGLVRSRSEMDVAVKNIVDFIFIGLMFWLVGYGLMFGSSVGGFFGQSDFAFSDRTADHWTSAFFLFQLVCCATSMTVLSGAVSERMLLRPYIWIVLLCGGFALPIFGHWAWAGLATVREFGSIETPQNAISNVYFNAEGWLGKFGFIDYAGATVIHSFAGWTALVAVLVVGNRPGRFEERYKSDFYGHNLPLTALGLFLLWFGWYGFTSGRALTVQTDVSKIIVNITLAGAAGGATGLVIAKALNQKANIAAGLINGTLSGLVAISASCVFVWEWQAALLGIVAAAITYAGSTLLARMKIDDAVDAISVHGVGGVVGTLALPLAIESKNIRSDMSRLEFFGVQLVGCFVCFVFAVLFAIFSFWLIGRFMKISLNDDDHESGIDLYEYEVSTNIADYDELFGKLGKAELDISDQESIAKLAKGVTQYELLMEFHNRYEREVEFIQQFSHEVRTPVEMIRMAFELYDRQDVGFDDWAENLKPGFQNTKWLLTLLNNAMQVSQIKSGKFETKIGSCGLVELVSELRRRFHLEVMNKGIDFDIQYHSHIPKDVLTDQDIVTQVLSNLLRNAIHATEHGKIIIGISVSKEPSQFRIKIEVEDTGTGMDKATLARCKEWYFRGSKKDRRPGGLGLALCDELAGLLNGKIDAESELGKGSTFVFEFVANIVEPVVSLSAIEAKAAEENVLAAKPVVQEIPRLDGKRVLLVEDSYLCEQYSELLGLLGAQVVQAQSREEAIDMFKAQHKFAPFDVIWMDWQMDRTDDGRLATIEIKGLDPKVPVVAVTAYPNLAEEVKSVGCSSYFKKPIENWQHCVEELYQAMGVDPVDIPKESMAFGEPSDHEKQRFLTHLSDVNERIANSNDREEWLKNVHKACHWVGGQSRKSGFPQLERIAKRISKAVRPMSKERVEKLVEEYLALAAIVGGKS